MIKLYLEKIEKLLVKENLPDREAKLSGIKEKIASLIASGLSERDACRKLGDPTDVVASFSPQPVFTKNQILLRDIAVLAPAFLVGGFCLLCIFGLVAIAGYSSVLYLVKSFTSFTSALQKAGSLFVTVLCVATVVFLFFVGLRLTKSVVNFSKRHLTKRKERLARLATNQNKKPSITDNISDSNKDVTPPPTPKNSNVDEGKSVTRLGLDTDSPYTLTDVKPERKAGKSEEEND